MASKTFSAVSHGNGYAKTAAVNSDGSRVAIADSAGLWMYDGSFNLLGPLPGGGLQGAIFIGGMVFSSDNKYLYEISNPTGVPSVYTIDPNSLQASQVAPALGMIPVSSELFPPFFMAEPFAVNSTGLVLGIQDYGISFDDATYGQNFAIKSSFANIYATYETVCRPNHWRDHFWGFWERLFDRA